MAGVWRALNELWPSPLFMLGTAAAELRRRARWAEAVDAVAERRGLQTHQTFGTTHSASGAVGAHRLHLDVDVRSTGGRRATSYRRLRVWTQTPMGMEASDAGGGSWVGRRLRAGGVVLGDPAFDERVHLRGPPDELLALLGGAARAMLSEAVREGLTVSEACVEWSRPGLSVTPDALEGEVDRLLAVADQLVTPAEGVTDALAQRARVDGHPEVRAHALARLVRRDPAIGVQTAEALLRRAGVRVDRLGDVLLGGPADLVVGAAALCARAATVEAVEPLRGAAARLQGSPGVALAVPDAIRAIQARAPAGRGGGVSVSEGEDRSGGLSQADEAGKGGLSSPRPPRRGR